MKKNKLQELLQQIREMDAVAFEQVLATCASTMRDGAEQMKNEFGDSESATTYAKTAKHLCAATSEWSSRSGN